FRVEPGEIQPALRRHPASREAVVDVLEEADDRRLVAWLTAEGSVPDDGELRELLCRELPDYMMPAAFVPLAALPLTPHGKVDRRSLPPPALRALEGEAPPARTPTRELLAGLWQQVLGREPAGAGEHFFAAGGHSLLAIRLLSRVRDAFGLEIPIAALFAAPTLGGLAAAIDGAGRRQAAGAEVPPFPAIRRRPGERRAPLSFAQQRLWFLDRLQPDRAVYSLPTALVLRGALNAAALERSLGEVVRRHGTLRTRFVEEDGAPWQEILEDAGATSSPNFSLPRIDLGALPPERRPAERDRIGREEARRPFDLARGPLLRAALVRLAAGEHALFLNLHHIVSDAWSEDVLHREVSALYPAALATRA